jgi:pimeloyl-ACP methyl ester carboxylesterase
MLIKKTSEITYGVQEGKGTPLVFLHGLCESHVIWLDFIENFKESHIICIDLPGFGASEIYGNGSIRAMAEAVYKVLQKENVTQCVLIGHSLGGYVALEYAKKHSEKLKGLGLFHSHPFEDSRERKDARRKSIAHIDNYGVSTYVKQLFEGLAPTDFYEAHPEILQFLIEIGLKTKPHGVINALEAMRNRKLHDDTLRELSCPVLFIVGEKDQLISRANSLGQLSLPKLAAIHLLPNVGHIGMFEDKENTQQIVHRFVALCETMYG